MRYVEPASRSMRRDTSSVSFSLNWAGALRARLSIWIATSALLRPGRLLVPEKITSSISAARIDLCEVSPITQRSASTRFDLPHPFGPTTPVNPGSIRKSVASTKDLNPSRRRRVSFMRTYVDVSSLNGTMQEQLKAKDGHTHHTTDLLAFVPVPAWGVSHLE